MDKGIIIGVENETATRMNLPFVMFRQVTSVRSSQSIYLGLPLTINRALQTHLFLHHILRVHLDGGQIKEAVSFASHYQHLVFFAHALEILLHSVVEEDALVDRGPDAPEDTSSKATLLVAVTACSANALSSR